MVKLGIAGGTADTDVELLRLPALVKRVAGRTVVRDDGAMPGFAGVRG